MQPNRVRPLYAIRRLALVAALALNISSAAFGASAESNDDAVIGALLAKQAPPMDWRAYLKQRALKRSSPPSSDASLEAVVNYWRSAPENSDPDDETRARLLEACETAPEKLPDLLRWLALDSTDVQKRLKALFDRRTKDKTRDAADLAELLRTALMRHSRYFRDELIRQAFHPGDVGEDSADQAMSDFIRLDREAARMILLKKASGSNLREGAIGLTTLLRHFGSEPKAAAWREELKQIAVDTKAPREARRLALLEVASDKSEGVTRWFLSLFGERSLNTLEQYSARSTPLGDVVAQDPDYWIPKVAPLVENKNPTVQANAVNALIQFQNDRARADALKPLLPWLTNPKWAPDSEEVRGRLRLIQSLNRVDIPESVPGLLKVVESATGSELEGAAQALAHHGVREAAEPLKRSMAREKEMFHRRRITAAILELGGFTSAEQVDALRAYAVQMSTDAGRKEVEQADDLMSKTAIDPRVSVGQVIARAEHSDDEATKEILAAADDLSKTNEAAADLLRQFVAKWQTPSAIKAIVDRLHKRDLTAAWVQELIKARAKLAGPLGQIRDLHGAALGVQAGVTGEDSLVRVVLQGTDRVAQRALLAVARLGRVELPIPSVAQLLKATDEKLVHASELYLQGIDTAPAREALWKHWPRRARILGYPHYAEGDWRGDIYKSESHARDLVLRRDGPEEIYALLSQGTWGGRGQSLLLRYRDHVVLRQDEGNGRARQRVVSEKEFRLLRDWLEREQVDDLPLFDTGTFDGVQYEYLHVTRDGGRRVYMNNPPGTNAAPRVEIGRDSAETDPDPSIYGELTARMSALTEPAMEVSYPALSDMPGYQIVQAREQGEVSGLDLRDGKQSVGIGNIQRKTIEWHALNAEGPASDFTEEPSERDTINAGQSGGGIIPEEGPFKGRKLDAQWAFREEDGLWATRADGKKELIAKGIFGRPLLCPGGEWLVAAKTFQKNSWSEPNGVVRIDLKTRHVFPVDLPPAENFDPLAWVAAHQRVLLYRQRDDPRFLPSRDTPDPNVGPEEAEYYLMDPVTGQYQRVEGDFQPLRRLEGHQLQPTGNPHEFWAVIPENEADSQSAAVLGRYDTEHFRFTESMRFPSIWFQSWQIYVDEKNRLVWLAVNGDLLRISLPEEATN